MSNTHAPHIINLLPLLLILPYLTFSQKKNADNIHSREFPVIVDILPKTNKQLNGRTITASKARFMFIGKYADTIKLTEDAKQYFNFRYKTYIDSRGVIQFYADSLLKKSGLNIFVDTSQKLSIDQTPFQSNVYLQSEGQYVLDSIKTKKNYEEWLKQPRNLTQAIPLFIINNSKDTTFLDYQDLNAFVIQEAIDENGNWKPIEYWQYSWCGNSYDATGLLPNQFIVIKINKYGGNFETLLRVKLLNGKKVYYSNTFKGHINKEQFAPKDWNNKSTNNIFLIGKDN